MSKGKNEGDPGSKPEITSGHDKKVKTLNTARIKKAKRPFDEKRLEQTQKAKIREVQRKIFKDQDFDKHKKVDKKIGGVRGKFHPSLERTRKRT